MDYMVLDSAGNAVSAFDNLTAARAAMRAIVDREPDAAHELMLVQYDAEGHAVGEAHLAEDFVDVPLETGFLAWTGPGTVQPADAQAGYRYAPGIGGSSGAYLVTV